MEKYIITALIVWIIISTVLLLFVIISVSKNKTKQERELEDREQEEFVSSLKKQINLQHRREIRGVFLTFYMW